MTIVANPESSLQGLVDDLMLSGSSGKQALGTILSLLQSDPATESAGMVSPLPMAGAAVQRVTLPMLKKLRKFSFLDPDLANREYQMGQELFALNKYPKDVRVARGGMQRNQKAAGGIWSDLMYRFPTSAEEAAGKHEIGRFTQAYGTPKSGLIGGSLYQVPEDASKEVFLGLLGTHPKYVTGVPNREFSGVGTALLADAFNAAAERDRGLALQPLSSSLDFYNDLMMKLDPNQRMWWMQQSGAGNAGGLSYLSVTPEGVKEFFNKGLHK